MAKPDQPACDNCRWWHRVPDKPVGRCDQPWLREVIFAGISSYTREDMTDCPCHQSRDTNPETEE